MIRPEDLQEYEYRPAPGFTEEWFGQASQDVLAGLGRQAVDGMIVEIGSWEGRSTIALANAVHPREVHAVDTWAGSPGEISADLAADRDVLAQFRANIAHFTKGNVTENRMSWRTWVAPIGTPIALAFIDAEHTYTEVRDNIAAILPKVAPGGIICGDDAHHPPIRQALCELFNPADVTIQATVWIWRKPSTDLGVEYRRLCATPSDIWLHLPRMVELVEHFDAQHVIELGTRTGVSTIAWLYALERTGGRLTSVDIDVRPAIGEYDHWTFIQGSDLDPAITGALAPADIVFIDTSHLYDQTVQELNVYRWLVKSGGVIVCHDTELATPEGSSPGDRPFPVKRAIERFVADNGFKWMNYSDNNGLGVIKVV